MILVFYKFFRLHLFFWIYKQKGFSSALLFRSTLCSVVSDY